MKAVISQQPHTRHHAGIDVHAGISALLAWFPFFFSVLRLCGSRQVVAHCCADERIIQMHILCPSLGSRKWSADHYAVRSLVRPIREETQKQSKTTKTKPTKPSERSTDKDSSNGAGNLCANELRDLARKQKTNTRPHSKILRRCQQNNPLSSAETQDPPCQDPGDRTEKPSGHETSSQ